MLKYLIITALLGTGIATAIADDAPPMTVEQCRSILIGLNALNCAGEQVGGWRCPKGSR